MEKDNKENKSTKETRRRVILMIIALIIIILALITSCSCTSKFFGKIGSLFRNEEKYLYVEKDGNHCIEDGFCEVILNRNLSFDQDKLNISLDDDKPKLTFSYYGVDLKDFTCVTSDANVATCYVNKSGYVVVKAKTEGTVIVTLQSIHNDKVYQATSTVTIGNMKKGIILQQYKGTINLYNTNKKSVIYRLINMGGTVEVSSSDESIATPTAKDGLLKITAHKTGKVSITLTVQDNGRTYKATYLLTVVNKSSEKPSPIGPGSDKEHNAYLSSLTTNRGAVSPKFNPKNDKYKIELKKDVNDIKIIAEKSGKHSTIEYSYKDETNTTGYFKNLIEGENTIKVTVTAEDGTKNYYYVTVIVSKSGTVGPVDPDKEHNAYLSSLTTDKGAVSPKFDPKKDEYKIELKKDVNDIKIIAEKSGKHSTIEYSYKNEVNTTGIFKNLDEGENRIKVTVTAEDGTKNYYYVTVIVSKSGSEDSNSKLVSLTTDSGDLTPTFKPDVFGSINDPYTIKIDAKDNDIKIIAKASETAKKIEYTYRKVTNTTGEFDNLLDGDNIITVTVTAEDGSQSTYYINVIKPTKYELDFEFNLVECKYEDKTCRINYTFKKNGDDLTDVVNDIKLEIIGNFDGTYKLEPGIVSLTPNTSYIQNDIRLKITYNARNGAVSSETTVKFKTDSYYVKPGTKEYDAYTNTNRPINIVTNLFKNDSEIDKENILNDMIVINNTNGKGFKLVSKHDQNLWLEVSTKSDIIDKINLDKEAGLSDMIINTNASSNGTAIINVLGSAYGKTINDTIKINVYKQYKVILSAGEGIFNPLTKEYEPFTISDKKEENTISLANLDKPYLTIPGDDCYSYKFLGFANSEDLTKILYSIDGKNYPNVIKIDEITKDTKLVAVYDKDPVNKEPVPPTSDILWAVNVPLFYNKEYHDKYNKDKIIYPGAKGEYTLKLGNATDKKITITGMILQEETICVDVTGDGVNDGCLNMAYQVKAAQNLDGVSTDVYKTLYKGTDTEDNKKRLYKTASYKEVDNGKGKDQNRRYIYKDDWDFDLTSANDEKIMSIEPGVNEEDGLHITVIWEWIFDIDKFNDKIDTAIGNYATKKDDSINNMYSLSIGLKLKIEDKPNCVYPSN